MKKTKFNGTIHCASFVPADYKEWDQHLRDWEGEKVTIEIKKFRQSRSNQQNSYYWAVVVKYLSDHTGYDKDEMNDLLKYRFLKEEIVGGGFKIGSFADLKTLEFEGRMTKIRMWASRDLEVYIPTPRESKYY